MARNNAPKSTPHTKPQHAEHAHEPQGAHARSDISHEQIARRAYEIYMARGGKPGNHEQDWQQAERELKLGRQ
ncbi:DUF2934 domain-containing protein [Myxococcus sp. XM-1-1-1]|uniref:DUF2934 domain-containing protein n=1 Tax=Myxococcus TaxID=32 RepID=UPI001CBB30A4|nr:MULTISPECIES: DUF2934 domain-containing protein [Myxococcus]MBZ4412899.1 DUF2934 domain-containing protein [Myxococcus sp. XM-1-1-1]MCK8501269.1 DUF2934 domain-containing protein [Myxococcus fulvus]BDT32713.1 DUF2934 domain-containing protein [Myxococcus sp. MH1]